MHYRHAAALCLSLAVALSTAAVGRAEFPLKDGDTWVFAGDSITAQKLHTNYIEAFCYARYPKMTFRFRNSGIGGDTIPRVMARFDYDVAAWRPTVVSVELGMNDKGGFSVEQYIANMGKLTEMIRTAKARPVFFAASPVNDGATSDKLTGGNLRLHQYALALKEFAGREKAPYADQFHALVDVWGKNKPREVLANSLPALKGLAEAKELEGAEHLKAFLEAQAKNPTPLVSMQGDAVHPGPNGQLMMAAALLQGLGAQGFVSSVRLDADKGVEGKGCKVEPLAKSSGTLTFKRTDECLPFPIPEGARAVLPLSPAVLELSQYTLQAVGLPSESYQLSVDQKPIAVLSAKELEKGVNLTTFDKGPIADQGKAILAAVQAKEALVQTWRTTSRAAGAKDAPADAREKLEALTKQVEEADAKIRVAAKPKTLTFELKPMK